jgi:phosphoglycolate phosphatase-like HAD superfamily hydrolase
MIHAILFDAGDILYSKPSRQQAFDAFLLSRGYAASKNPDPIAKEMRLKAHAGQMSELEFFERLMADPAIYMAALDPIGVHPQNAAFVGHAKKELDGAKALDITTIRFNPDPDCVEADFTANSFRDILDLSCIVESANTMSANKPSI